MPGWTVYLPPLLRTHAKAALITILESYISRDVVSTITLPCTAQPIGLPERPVKERSDIAKNVVQAASFLRHLLGNDYRERHTNNSVS